MASENETIADIIAEMRERAEAMQTHGTTHGVKLAVREFANRIEAAWKRECEASRAYWTKKCRDTITEHDRYCSPVGNAAAMREALEEIRVEAMSDYEPDADYLIEKCNAALSAPARNCDLYATATEALKAQDVTFNEDNFKNGECRLGCPGCDDGLINCKILWLFAPAAERKGEGDGSK